MVLNISNYLLSWFLYCYNMTLYTWWISSNNVWKCLSSTLKPKKVFCIQLFWKLCTQRIMEIEKSMYHIQCKICGVRYRFGLIKLRCTFLQFLGGRGEARLSLFYHTHYLMLFIRNSCKLACYVYRVLGRVL